MKSCKTCRFARWELTPAGRIRHTAGRCVAELPVVVAPISVRVQMGRIAIWADMGADCPVYEPNTGPPIQRSKLE